MTDRGEPTGLKSLSGADLLSLSEGVANAIELKKAELSTVRTLRTPVLAELTRLDGIATRILKEISAGERTISEITSRVKQIHVEQHQARLAAFVAEMPVFTKEMLASPYPLAEALGEAMKKVLDDPALKNDLTNIVEPNLEHYGQRNPRQRVGFRTSDDRCRLIVCTDGTYGVAITASPGILPPGNNSEHSRQPIIIALRNHDIHSGFRVYLPTNNVPILFQEAQWEPLSHTTVRAENLLLKGDILHPK